MRPSSCQQVRNRSQSPASRQTAQLLTSSTTASRRSASASNGAVPEPQADEAAEKVINKVGHYPTVSRRFQPCSTALRPAAAGLAVPPGRHRKVAEINPHEASGRAASSCSISVGWGEPGKGSGGPLRHAYPGRFADCHQDASLRAGRLKVPGPSFGDGLSDPVEFRPCTTAERAEVCPVTPNDCRAARLQHGAATGGLGEELRHPVRVATGVPAQRLAEGLVEDGKMQVDGELHGSCRGRGPDMVRPAADPVEDGLRASHNLPPPRREARQLALSCRAGGVVRRAFHIGRATGARLLRHTKLCRGADRAALDHRTAVHVGIG